MSKNFSDLKINKELQQSLVDLKITIPTEIQEKVIPIILNQLNSAAILY